MLITRTYHHNATFGLRYDTERTDSAPIVMHIGTMADGWLEPRITVLLTVDDTRALIADLERIVEEQKK
jgi:hypothetical protein